MGMRTEVKWHGDKVLAAVQRKEASLIAAGIIVHAAATKLCPVGIYPKGSGRVGGNLRSSISYALEKYALPTTAKEGGGLQAHGNPNEVWIGTNVYYSPWVEKGTRKMSARPFLLPALRNNEARIKNKIKQIYGHQIQGSV